jgi:glycosyltransferase involved in cell wall biosynthesis
MHNLKKNIEKNRNYFDKCLKSAEDLVQSKQYELAANYLKSLATFAWGNFTGYYTNWKLEQLLNKIGYSLKCDIYNRRKIDSEGSYNILHVATKLYETGGHTRLVLNWIKNDNHNRHSVIVTNQRKGELPLKIVRKLGLSESIFSVLDQKSSILDRAAELRKVSNDYDCVILHIHPDDVIPVIAYSTEKSPAISFLNHADHTFWIGASVSDVLMQIRESNIRYDNVRRGIERQIFIPIPLPNEQEAAEEIKQQSREAIGIRDNQIVLLTTGTEYKYRPFGSYNFFEHILEVLHIDTNIVLLIAGIAPDSPLALKYKHDQICYLGVVEDLDKYENACDIYIETFPFPSFTAMLQAAIKGKPVHLLPNPYPIMRFFSDDGNNCFQYPKDKAEWVCKLKELIQNKQLRYNIKKRQLNFLRSNYQVKSWNLKVKSLYKDLVNTVHKVRGEVSSTYHVDDNEVFLSSLNPNFSIGHFNHCYKLSFYAKIRHILFFVSHKPNSVVLGKRSLIQFLIPFYHEKKKTKVNK